MPLLANSQYEVFAKAIAAGYSQTESAKRANYSAIGAHNTGSRLIRVPAIAQRIAELRVTSQPNELASKEWVVCEVIENHRLARASGDISVSRQCLELLARLQGYLVEKRESYSERLQINLSTMDSRQLNSTLRQHIQQLPASERQKLLAEAPAEVIEMLATPVVEDASNDSA